MGDNNENDSLSEGFKKVVASKTPSRSDTDLHYDTFKNAIYMMVHGYGNVVRKRNIVAMEDLADVILEVINKVVPDQGAKVKLAQDAWMMTAENTPLRQKLAEFVKRNGWHLDESYTFGAPTNGYLQ